MLQQRSAVQWENGVKVSEGQRDGQHPQQGLAGLEGGDVPERPAS